MKYSSQQITVGAPFHPVILCALEQRFGEWQLVVSFLHLLKPQLGQSMSFTGFQRTTLLKYKSAMHKSVVPKHTTIITIYKPLNQIIIAP